MKQYRIIKIISAKNFLDAVKNEAKAELVFCELADDITKNNKIGFN